MADQLFIEAQLQAPLCIARRPTAPGQPVETLPYISGTVLRGGLASAWLKGRRYEDLDGEQATFRSLFLSPDMMFGNCWPARSSAETLVVPLTAWTQKYGGGWRGDDDSGVHDQLAAFLSGIFPDTNWDRVGHPFVMRDEDGAYSKLEPRQRLIARTAIESGRGVAREARLYTLEALETGQVFTGVIQGDAARLQQLEQFWATTPAITTSFGQGRSRGLGRVTIRPVDSDDSVMAGVTPADSARLATEVERFTERVRAAQAQGGKGASVGSNDVLLPITLESDVLLRDHYLLPSSDPRPTVTLGRYLRNPPVPHTMELVLEGVVQSTHWLGGWDELRRVPRPPQLAVTMRSVWTFKVDRSELGAAITWWQAAEAEGLGERRVEGYGRVRLCHPIHVAGRPL